MNIISIQLISYCGIAWHYLSDYFFIFLLQSGAIRLVDDEILYMEPVPHHLLDHVHHDEHLPHLVVKKTEKDFQRENKVIFDTEGSFIIKVIH
jgi:hypothetical protein